MSAQGSFSKQEFYQDYAAALEDMDALLRLVFEVVIEEGEPGDAAAKRLGLQQRQVHRLYTKARAYLAERLAGYRGFA